MAEFKTIQDKYEFLTKNARPVRGMVWLANPSMDKPGNPVLIQSTEDKFKRPGSALVKQGYVRYTPTPRIEAPVGKKVKASKEEVEPTESVEPENE